MSGTAHVGGPDRPLHGEPSPRHRLHPRLYAAEFLGTALLVSVGLSIVIVFFGTGSPIVAHAASGAWRRLVAGTLFGSVGALITVSPLGRLSGAHLNPAVTFAFWLEQKIAWRDALGYVASQLAGGIVGAAALLAWGAMGASIQYGASLPAADLPIWWPLAGEVAATLALILLIFMTAAHPRTRRLTPLGLPVLFGLLVWCEGPLSGASTNPARSLGPGIVADVWAGQWIYVAGPLLGAGLAIGCVHLELFGRHRVEVARLFHFREEGHPVGRGSNPSS